MTLANVAPIGASAEPRSRPDGSLIIEVHNHRRVLLGGEKHVGEFSCHVGPDRLIFEQAHDCLERLLVGRYCEVIRPEMHEPLIERVVAGCGSPVTGRNLPIEIIAHRPRVLPDLIGRGLIALRAFPFSLRATQVLNVDEDFR
jgi:hypothetical protein